MKNISIWQDSVNDSDKYKALDENIDVDIPLGKKGNYASQRG